MIITKEHQEAMVNNYRATVNNELNVDGFIDGMNAMFELIKRNDALPTAKEKYIIKDSCNTYIKMVDSLQDVYNVLDKKKEFFKNERYSTFGGSLDGSKTYEDNAVFEIPEDMRVLYNNNKYIKFYFFKFDLVNNKMIELY